MKEKEEEYKVFPWWLKIIIAIIIIANVYNFIRCNARLGEAIEEGEREEQIQEEREIKKECRRMYPNDEKERQSCFEELR